MNAAMFLIPACFAVAVLVAVVQPPFRYFLFLLFMLVAWCPEFSQTDLTAWTAADAPTIYNYRLIPSVTASVFDYMFAGIVLVWVAKYVLPNPRRVLEAPLALPMAAFFSVWIFSFIYGLSQGNETYNAMREFRNQAYFVITYLMIVTACRSARDARRFFKLCVAMAFLVGIYGVFRFFLGIGLIFMDHVVVFYDIADSMLLYMAMFFLAAGAIESKMTSGRAFLTVTLVFPMILTFLFSYRRGAWVGFAAGLFFLVYFYPGRPRLRRIMFRRVCVPAIAAIALIASVPVLRTSGLDFVKTRFYSIFDVSEDPSNVFRILDALNAVNSFTHHPIVGVGAGGRYEIEFAANDPVTAEFMDHVSNTSHDAYLFTLFKTGIVGFLAYFTILFAFWRTWFKTRALHVGPTERAALMAMGAMVIAILVTGITEPITDLVRPSLLFAFVMGWGAVWMTKLREGSILLTQPKLQESSKGQLFAE